MVWNLMNDIKFCLIISTSFFFFSCLYPEKFELFFSLFLLFMDSELNLEIKNHICV